ncbi:MAG: hypothetical protein WBM44_20360 [Waterburya sp.]
MHNSSISLSKESTTSSLSDAPREERAVKSFDDDIPGLIESVVNELGADLATDLVEISSNSARTDRIESGIETCNRIGFCVSKLLSTALPLSSQKQQQQEEEEGGGAGGDQYIAMEQQALIEELKSELLFLMRLCAELIEDIRPSHQGSASHLHENACRVAELCHPYELLSLVRTSQSCHFDDITTTRLSALYELEHLLTQLLTIPHQQSLWTSFLQCIRQWWS